MEEEFHRYILVCLFKENQERVHSLEKYLQAYVSCA